MKRMTKALALILAAVMMVANLPAAFAEEAAVTAAPPVTGVAPAQLSLEQQVLIAYAEAMLARGARVQYDDTQMVPAADVRDYRWQRQTRVAESYTSQFDGYTNCAAFTHDVYYFALGFDIQYWATSQLIKADEKELMYYYKVTGKETEEEKAAMREQFMATLQPADILVYRLADGTNGHALFHVGNGRIIHSSTPGGGNYSYTSKTEKREPNGSIAEMDVNRFFDDASYSRNFFGGNISQIGIVRPLNVWEGTVPQMSIDRMNNLSGVVAEKLSSYTVGQTILPGEEVTYTIRMENRNGTPVTLHISDEVPAYTTLVTAGELKWDVTVEAGKTAEVTYTVKVNADAPMGAGIVADKAVISGVSFPCPTVYVGKHLTQTQKADLAKAAGEVKSDKTGLELAGEVYAKLDMDLSAVTSLPILFDSLLPASAEVADHYALNMQSPYFAALAPTMFGGYMVLKSEAYDTVRTRTPYLNQLEVGDVAFATFAPYQNAYVGYMVVGEDAVLALDTAELLTGEAAQKAMDTLISYNKFVVVRPAALPDKEAVAGLTASAASEIPQVEELVGEGEATVIYTDDFEQYPVGEDALWPHLLAGDNLATNVTEKDDATVRYDIVEEDGNRALQLFSAKKKTPWMKVNRQLVGDFTIQLDFKFNDNTKVDQFLYMTLFQDSKVHGFVHLTPNGVRFQYKPLPTDQTSGTVNAPAYMLLPETTVPGVWHTIKIARVDGGLYVKLWDKGQTEPEEWMLSLRNDVLDTDQPAYFRMQYYMSGVTSSVKLADITETMLVDNLVVTQQAAERMDPTAACTRGQAVTALWRAAGSPEPVSKENPFADVKDTDTCYKAVLWAYENGITAGTSATTFSPDGVVKRGQLVTFLYRAAKAVADGSVNPYTDVPADAYFYAPALWAAEKGGMAGVGETAFAPAEDCTCGLVEAAIAKVFAN